MLEKCILNPSLKDNDAYKYAAARNALYNKGKVIEVLVNYEPSLHYFNEWWKQLFGESEGKDNKGLFPAAVDFTYRSSFNGTIYSRWKKNTF